MIFGELQQRARYHSQHPLFAQAFDWLSSLESSIPDGVYPLAGEDLVGRVSRYSTQPYTEKLWEAHRLFGDIQVVLEGEELCGYGSRAGLSLTRPYQADKDIEKFAPPNQPDHQLHLKPGLFAVFLPDDAHQPGVQVQDSLAVTKVVVKFRL